MTDYSKKKKLLDDNKDIYISEYDKNLSYDALSQIVDAKKRYAQAARDGDKAEMTRSNNVANAVRAKYGSYTAGNSGNEYKPFVYADTSYEDYTSKYEDKLDSLYDSIIKSRDSFSYDYTQDPAYQAYKEVYDKQGQLAYERALSENSLRTSGVQNSNAQSAAMQALGYYNSQLAAKIPELYEAAYQRHYKDEQNRLGSLIDAYGMISDREERDYSRHLDRLANQKDLRNFAYEREQDMLDRGYKTATDQMNREFEFALAANDASMKNLDILYDLMRDSIDDEKWRVNHNLNAYKKGYPSYRGSIGNSSILDYARTLFGNSSLTMEDLYNLLGL